MAITNLTGTKWYFNETITFTGTTITAAINYFDSNNQTFRKIIINTTNIVGLQTNAPADYMTTTLYDPDMDGGDWYDQAYRTITITGGADVENADLISFLEANAVEIKPLEFTETKTALKVYEDLTEKEYNAITKEPNSFYIVNDVGVYKGDKLIATSVDKNNYQRRLDKPSATYQLPVNNTNKYYIPEDILETIKLNSVVSLSFMDNSTATDITVYGIVNAKSGKYMSLQTCCVSSNYSDEMLLVYNISFFDNISLQGINVSTNNLNSTFDLDTTTPSVTLKIF